MFKVEFAGDAHDPTRFGSILRGSEKINDVKLTGHFFGKPLDSKYGGKTIFFQCDPDSKDIVRNLDEARFENSITYTRTRKLNGNGTFSIKVPETSGILEDAVADRAVTLVLEPSYYLNNKENKTGAFFKLVDWAV